MLSHPRRRLHVFTSRGKGLLARQGRVRTPLGYAGAFAANLLHRRAMGLLLERVVFSDARDVLPLALHGSRVDPARATTVREKPRASPVCASGPASCPNRRGHRKPRPVNAFCRATLEAATRRVSRSRG